MGDRASATVVIAACVISAVALIVSIVAFLDEGQQGATGNIGFPGATGSDATLPDPMAIGTLASVNVAATNWTSKNAGGMVIQSKYPWAAEVVAPVEPEVLTMVRTPFRVEQGLNRFDDGEAFLVVSPLNRLQLRFVGTRSAICQIQVSMSGHVGFASPSSSDIALDIRVNDAVVMSGFGAVSNNFTCNIWMETTLPLEPQADVTVWIGSQPEVRLFQCMISLVAMLQPAF